MKNKIWVVLFFAIFVGNAGAASGFQGPFSEGIQEQDVLEQTVAPKNKEKNFTCLSCGKSFGSSSTLKVHLRVHTGARPYKCNFEDCDKSFTHSGNLKRHERLHVNEKPYECSICGKLFTQLNGLRDHERVHTGEAPYTCSFLGCLKSFSTSSDAKDHMNTHTGDRPYTCSVCGNSFGHRSTLRNHERLHTGEKPYSCEVCGKSFTQNSNCKSHQKNAHGIESRSEKAVAAAAESDENLEWTVQDLEDLRNGLSVPAGQTMLPLGLANFEADKARAVIAFFELTREEIENATKIDELGDIFGNGGSDEE